MKRAQIEVALTSATREQLEKALKKKRQVRQAGRVVGSYCPNGCGSIRNSHAMPRHLREECTLPLKPGDTSANWMAVALGETQLMESYDAGFPDDVTAKCEIILHDRSRHTSVFVSNAEDGRKMWDLRLIGSDLLNANDVLAWKVQEHSA